MDATARQPRQLSQAVEWSRTPCHFLFFKSEWGSDTCTPSFDTLTSSLIFECNLRANLVWTSLKLMFLFLQCTTCEKDFPSLYRVSPVLSLDFNQNSPLGANEEVFYVREGVYVSKQGVHVPGLMVHFPLRGTRL